MMGPRRKTALAWLLAVIIATGFATARIHIGLNDPNFDRGSADGMLRSDPALLYYITDRIIEAGGMPPADFRADVHVQHPLPADLPAMFTVGQEFLVAWAYLAFGGAVPLHVFCVWIMGIVAAGAVLGVFGLAWELTGKAYLGAVAALLYVCIPVNYRTVGFILMREDLSFPLFVLHLYLMVRTFRRRSLPALIGSALALAGALATWHAMGFFVALEAAVLFLWYLWSGENPFARRWVWIAPAIVASAGLIVPALRSKLFLLSPTMLLMLSMLFLARLDPSGVWTLRKRAGAALGSLASLLTVSFGISTWIGAGQLDYGHVYRFLLQKIVRLGVLPANPLDLSFEARLLWQGPFVTTRFQEFLVGLPLGIVMVALALIVVVKIARRRRREADLVLLTAFAVLSLVSGWLVQRTLILPGMITPVLAALAFARAPIRMPAWILAATVLIQATVFLSWVGNYRISWYLNPTYNAEVASLARWSRENLPSDAGVAGDFVHSTILLAHNRNPIVCQPKYETRESRRRFEEFLTAYFHRSPQEVVRFARRYDAKYVLIDRIGLWSANRYIAGVPPHQTNPKTGSGAEVFASQDADRLTGIPGLRLVYRSPPRFPTDLFRVYEVLDQPLE